MRAEERPLSLTVDQKALDRRDIRRQVHRQQRNDERPDTVAPVEHVDGAQRECADLDQLPGGDERCRAVGRRTDEKPHREDRSGAEHRPRRPRQVASANDACKRPEPEQDQGDVRRVHGDARRARRGASATAAGARGSSRSAPLRGTPRSAGHAACSGGRRAPSPGRSRPAAQAAGKVDERRACEQRGDEVPGHAVARRADEEQASAHWYPSRTSARAPRTARHAEQAEDREQEDGVMKSGSSQSRSSFSEPTRHRSASPAGDSGSRASASPAPRAGAFSTGMIAPEASTLCGRRSPGRIRRRETILPWRRYSRPASCALGGNDCGQRDVVDPAAVPEHVERARVVRLPERARIGRQREAADLRRGSG